MLAHSKLAGYYLRPLGDQGTRMTYLITSDDSFPEWLFKAFGPHGFEKQAKQIIALVKDLKKSAPKPVKQKA